MIPEDLALLTTLSDQQKQYALTLYASREKETTTAYILWCFFGCHYFYLGKIFTNILMWLLWPLFIGAIWWFIDLFRMKSLVQRKNHEILSKCIQEAVMLYPRQSSGDIVQ